MPDSPEPEEGLDLFDDADYYPPTPPPTSQTYTTQSGEIITLHLVGHSPLEAHHLWNGARVVASHFEADPALVRGRTVLELGAGAGLPSVMAAALGARRVVVTDFPDPDLVENMWRNVRGCALIPEDARTGEKSNIVVRGFVWGADPAPLLACLDDEIEGGVQAKEERSTSRPAGSSDEAAKKFDVQVLADLLFRHSEHGKLVDTIEATLKRSRESAALVVFTSYRPWLQHKDLAFFDLARERGFDVEQIFERKMDRPLFENDPGDEEVRKTVLGFTVRWPENKCVI